jgi:hypothetical protein
MWWTAPPIKPIALPAPRCPRYVIPGSQNLDPPYSWQMQCAPPWINGRFPWPRVPWPWESETRAAGTGLIATPCPAFPPTCPPPSPPTVQPIPGAGTPMIRQWRR